MTAAVVDGVDVDAVHHRAAAVPGVRRVGGAAPGSLATYLIGRRVPGVRVGPELVEVEVVAAWPHAPQDVARGVQRALGPLVAARSVHVTVTDIELPDQTDEPQPSEES